MEETKTQCGVTQIRNKRILKNTIFLYFRMLLIIVVGLYTSRILLEKLGFEDYGIYNVVGGVIVLFSFLGTALNSATQRFLSIELGKNNLLGVSKVFSTSICIYLLLSIIILIGAETIGLWFLNTQMNFPQNRVVAVNYVYQISIFTFILNALRTPFNACIISYERMSFYAYTSIIEAVLKLLVVYIIDKSGIDQLIFYALLIMGISIILLVWYIFYCRYNFLYFRLYKKIDRSYFKAMFNFSGWSLWGSLAVIGSNQGINILLNIFFGVIINAGMGIANQVANIINQFSSSFQIAFNPQIVKGYANNELENVTQLVFSTARISFFLLFVIAIPFLIDAEYILGLWLNDVPNYAKEFTFYLLVSFLIEAIAAPLYMTIQATGRIKNYQITVSIILMFNIILGYIFLKLNFSPVFVIMIRCFVALFLLFYRIIIVSKVLKYSINSFFKSVLYRIFFVSILCFIPLYYFKKYIDIIGFLYFIISILLCLLVIYSFGLQKQERRYLNNYIKMKICEI